METQLKILVTGGAGFIGSNLTKALIRQGHKVIVLDDFSTGLRSNISGLKVEVVDGSITDKNLVAAVASGTDAIVHLAARGSVPRSLRNPQATFDVNVQGTLNICEIARLKATPVIFSSSSSVYGANTRDKKLENEWLSPLSPYAASKLSGESLVVSFARSYGIPTAVFRLFNVYGPGQRPEHQYSAVIPKWIWAALKEEEIKVFGDGRTSRDFTYIDNVVKILMTTVLESRYFDGVTNLAFGKPITLIDLLAEIRKEFPNLQSTHSETRAGDIRNSDNGSDRLFKLFPEVKATSIVDGILATTNWLKSMRSEIESHPMTVSDD